MAKGFNRGHAIGEGMYYESISTGTNFDIIVKGIGGQPGNRTATIKVKGRASLDEICLFQGGNDRVIAPGVVVGMSPNQIKIDEVTLYHYAISDIELNGRKYYRFEYQ